MLKVAALQAAASDLRAAGLLEEASLLQEPTKRLEKEGAASDKPGARLDACVAYVARAERRAAAASEAVEAAERTLQEARARQATLEEELAAGRARLESLRAGLSAVEEETSASHGDLIRCTKALLQRLESGSFAATAAVTPEILAAMHAAHAVIGAVEPALSPSLDAALEPEAPALAPEAPAPGAEFPVARMERSAAEETEDDAMVKLDGLDEDDEVGLLAAARRLKSARRSAPY